MKELALLAIVATSLLSAIAQEPPTYKPEDLKEGDFPKGVTAEEYLRQVYEERHYKIKVTFRVIGEDGTPIPNADIDVGIDSLLHADGHNNYKGKTDAKGLFTVESRGRGCTAVLVEKEGFYPSRPEVEWDGDLNPGGAEMHKNGGFRPWNPTIDVTLRRVGKPIPMRVWRGGSDGAHRAPGLDEEFGFDLFEKDWVQPHGAGKHEDLLVKFTSDFEDQNNYQVTCLIRFVNPDDGFISVPEIASKESLLKYPREAPLDGYDLKELKLECRFGGAREVLEADKKNPRGYLVRMRSVKDEESGRITAAYYGKVVSSPKLQPFEIIPAMWVDREIDKMPRLQFNFYLNPTLNDRNMEYDQETNLAPNAPEGVTWSP